jgi:hypothetical protein
MLTTRQHSSSLLQAAFKPAASMMLMGQAPVRAYIPYYLKKYDDVFKPRYYDNVRR